MKKKGFTLIELLAVIVILAIIALIATPMVLNTIDEAKKGSAKSSAYSYVNGVETALASYMLKNNGVSYRAGNHDVEELDRELDVALKGDKPTDGKICIGSNGTVTKASLKISGYIVNYDGKEVKISDSNTVEDITCEGITTVTYQEYYTGTKTQVSTIYYNPVDNIKCTEADYNSNTDKLGKTGCMKWYAIENSDSTKSTVDVILDHNTTALTAYASVQTEFDSLVSESGWKVTPRSIKANEIASITGNGDFDVMTRTKSEGGYLFDSNDKTQIATSQGESNYAWLFDYTSGCTNYGCDIEMSGTFGYWTADLVVDDATQAWDVLRGCSIAYNTASLDSYVGVRPVITISKSVIE